MAGDAANIVLGAIIEKLITPVVDGIGRQFGYLFCYKTNIKNMTKTAAQLEKSGNDADNLFQEQRRNNEQPAQSSVGWLDDVRDMIKDAKQVEEATDKFRGCLNLKSRYVLSRKSTKLAADIQKLKSKAPQGITTNTVRPAGRLRGASANKASKGYKTRMQTLDEVMNALEDPSICVIGICGLGGVGKTTMVHEVREEARNQNLFDEIAMTTVSQKIDLFKIQGDLAEMLDLKAIKEKVNVIARADQLCTRLSSGNKVLIILDDVWSNINLMDIGIPLGSEHTKCKVLITSRQEGVCKDIQKNIKVHALAQKEARALFRKTAGEHVLKNNLGEIADEVADKCGGLPIALLTLSRALSNKDRKAWEDAHTQLNEGHITGITGMEKEVYQSIKFSYDFVAMEKKEAQPLLLLCCQHREDAKIDVEKLARYCLSLDLFEGVSGVVRARNRVYSLVEYLKSCFLLQAVGADEAVKVHDVVRDVCLSIVSEERDRVCMHIWKEEYDAGIGTSGPDYQKFKLLMQVPLHYNDILGIKSFLEQTQELRVLESAVYVRAPYMDKQNYYPSLVPQFLTNLRMLSLEYTHVNPGVMSEFIRLTELEVLSFMGSTIWSFPHQIGQLSKLKLLDLRCRYHDWESVILIPSGILPKLTKLEVLFMGNHYFLEAPYCKGEGDVEKESCPGCIQELDSLTNLTTLQVDLLDPTQLLNLKYFRFEKLEVFSFGSAQMLPSILADDRHHFLLQNICLKGVGMKWLLGEDKFQSVVRRTVDLSLLDIEDLTNTSVLKQFPSLRKLVLKSCNQLENIIHDGSSAAFMNLETLKIKEMWFVRELCHNGHLPAGLLHKLQLLEMVDLPEMRHMWVGHTDPLCLVNLKVVEIEECGELKCIFPHSAAKCLSQLEKLYVRRCALLEGIVSHGGEGNSSTGRGGEITQESNDLQIHFPKLKEVTIDGSPNLRGFYNLDEDKGQSLFNTLVILPSMEKLVVRKNTSIKAVFDFEGLEAMNMREDECSLLQGIELEKLPMLEHFSRQIPKDVHIFKNLATLEVDGCEGLAYLMPSSIAHMLVNIQSLIVDSCKGMKEVISKMNGDLEKKIVFPSLIYLRLADLGNLSSFCSSDQHVFEFPSLQTLHINKCPEIETFCGQIPTVAHSGILEENVPKGEGTTTTGGGKLKIYHNQKPRVAEIKIDPRDLVALFPKLKAVEIKDTPNFRGFYNIDIYKGYQKLVNLEVGASYQLKQMVEDGGDNLVSVVASSSLNLVQNLKHIRLEKCEAIKTVLDFEGFDVTREDARPVFSRLETIWLRQFSNLEHVCKLVPREVNGFQNLRSLHVYGCDSLSYLLTSTMAHMLLNLKFLVVWNCKSMKEVIKMNDDCGANKIVFRSLCRVGFVSSEKLSSFCSSEMQDFDFPSLNQVYIGKCPAMTTFCRGHLTTEELRKIHFHDYYDDERDYGYDYYNDNEDLFDDNDGELFWKGDANETIHHVYARVNRIKSELKEDGVDEDDEVAGYEPPSKDDLNENARHSNASVPQISCHVREDDVGDKDAVDEDDIHVPEEGVNNEYNQCGNEEERYEAISRDGAVPEGIIESGSSGVHIPLQPQALKVTVSEGKQPNGDKVLGLGDFSIAPLTDRAKDEIIKILTQRLDTQQMEMKQLEEQQQHTQHQLSIARLVDKGKDEIIEILTQQTEMQQSQLSQALSLVQQQMRQYQSGNTS